MSKHLPDTTEHTFKKLHDSAPMASWVFGGLGFAFLIIVVFVDIKADKYPIIRFLMALTAALLAFFFVGGVLLKATRRGLLISATGGFALFVLIAFVVNPFAGKISQERNITQQPPNVNKPKSTDSDEPISKTQNSNSINAHAAPKRPILSSVMIMKDSMTIDQDTNLGMSFTSADAQSVDLIFYYPSDPDIPLSPTTLSTERIIKIQCKLKDGVGFVPGVIINQKGGYNLVIWKIPPKTSSVAAIKVDLIPIPISIR